MARRPEEPPKRNRRSAGLDWLAEAESPMRDDESPRPGEWPAPERPSPYAAGPAEDPSPPRAPRSSAPLPSRRELRRRAERELREARPPDAPARRAGGPYQPEPGPLAGHALPPSQEPWPASTPAEGQRPPDAVSPTAGHNAAPPASALGPTAWPLGPAAPAADAWPSAMPSPASDAWTPVREGAHPTRARRDRPAEGDLAPSLRRDRTHRPGDAGTEGETPTSLRRDRTHRPGDAGTEGETPPTSSPSEAPPLSRREARARAAADAPGAPTPDDTSSPDQGEGKQRTPKRRRVATWLTLAAVLLALWSATCFIDAGNLLVSGLTSVAPLVSILAIPVIAIGVGSKHPVPIAIAAVAALVPWTLVPGYAASGPGRVQVGDDNTLRVMSVNGAKGHASADSIVALAKTYEVDVVVVTELDNELAHDLTVAGLGNLAASRWVSIPAGSDDGTGLWSRLEVRDLKALPALSGASVEGNVVTGRGVIKLTAVQLGGDPLKPGSGWRGDLRELSKAPEGRGMIVGDLNASPWQPAFRQITGHGWRDAADVVGQGLRPTWPSWSPVPIAPLDHVLVSKGLGVNAADTANVAGTDHRALVVTLVVPRGGD